jgi:hypothetical protein
MRSSFLITIVFAFLTGCASTRTYFPLNPPNDGEATVQIFRESVRPYAFALEIFVDGEKAASLPDRSYAAFSVPAGEHSFLLEWPPGSLTPGKLEAKARFKGRDSRYFVVSEKDLPGPSTYYVFFSDRLRLFEVSAEYAEQLRPKLRQK